jgi:hypothetical protein
MRNFIQIVSLGLLVGSPSLFGQAKTAEPDVIVFTNGDKLVGHFVKSTGASVTFKSDMLGDVTVDWSKVKELHTDAKVAILRKGVKLRKNDDPSKIPQGTLAMENQNLVLAPAGGQSPQSIPVADSALVIDQPSFDKAVTHHPGLLRDWGGTVTLGASLVAATQDSESFNGAISLIRTEPTENWLDPRNRTILDFSTSYAEITQPSTPTVKTSIFHGYAERDEYFSPRLFAFGQAGFDHNFSQGLDLEQTYGGGIGVSILEQTNQQLDLKFSADYVRQQFQVGPNQSLIGSVINQHYLRKFKRGMTVEQHLTFTPTWNDTKAYSSSFGAVLTMPVYKRLGASTGVIDSFLNDPPPGFKKNSVQFTLGATYSLR